MKRFLLLFLAVLLLLCGCNKKMNRLEKTEQGYTDTKSGIAYMVLDPTYQPASRGEAFAEYVNEERNITRAFYEIPGLDRALFMTDEYLNVYFAGSIAPNAALWQIEAVLVCEEEAISVERCRLAAGTDDAQIAALRALWFAEDEGARLPIGAPAHTFAVKFAGKDYPSLYYNLTLQIYANGEVYLDEPFSGRTVQLSAELAKALCPSGTLGGAA